MERTLSSSIKAEVYWLSMRYDLSIKLYFFAALIQLSKSSSFDKKTNATLSEYSLSNFLESGSDAIHGAHQLAQKSTYTGLPLCLETTSLKITFSLVTLRK